jgi:predicted small lipoprotein YifL
MKQIFTASPSIVLVLFALTLAACTAGPPNTPQANRVQDRAMTGQTE